MHTALLVIATLMAASASRATEPAAQSPAAQAVAPAVGPGAAPSQPETDARLRALRFLAGSWCLSQPKGAMIQEQWTEPRGNAMVAVFRRVLGNGYNPFYEFTQIVAEEGRVVLRQIHVHADFDTDPRRAKPMVLRMVESSDSHVVFEPAGTPEEAHSADLARITYRRLDADTLHLKVESTPPKGPADPAKPEPAPAQVLEFRMTRCGG
ncbi:MAG: hypothetical protein FGM37_08440 [Phycisphaerales bacterium]|nr:hypothetical protein [Phycisphaerales bacterium]